MHYVTLWTFPVKANDDSCSCESPLIISCSHISVTLEQLHTVLYILRFKIKRLQILWLIKGKHPPRIIYILMSTICCIFWSSSRDIMVYFPTLSTMLFSCRLIVEPVRIVLILQNMMQRCFNLLETVSVSQTRLNLCLGNQPIVYFILSHLLICILIQDAYVFASQSYNPLWLVSFTTLKNKTKNRVHRSFRSLPPNKLLYYSWIVISRNQRVKWGRDCLQLL